MPSWRAAIEAGDLAHHLLEEARRASTPRLLGPSREAVDHHELDVGRVAHLAPAELAEAQRPRRAAHGRARPAGTPWRAPTSSRQVASALSTTASARSVIAAEKATRSTCGSSRCRMSASSISSSLKAFSSAALLLEGRGAREPRLEVAAELVAPAQRALPPGVEHGQQVLGLQPQEVLPQERARPEQARQLAQPRRRRQERERVARRGRGEHAGRRAARTSAAPPRDRARAAGGA